MEKKQKNWWRDGDKEGKRLFKLLANVGDELIIFDTETTGLSPETDSIIQISAIKCVIDRDHQFHEVDRLDIYINPEHKLEKKIVKITGITDAFLKDYPNENEQWGKIYQFFGTNKILCGHKVSFDIDMLTALYKRHGKMLISDDVCTLKMARELHHKDEVKNHKLGNLAEYFGLDYGLTFHNSMDDVIATMRLLRLFIEEYEEKQGPSNVQKVPVLYVWDWAGYRGEQRLYVKVSVNGELKTIYMNQRRPYDWDEKDVGVINCIDMNDVEMQTMRLCGAETLYELSKFRGRRYASYYQSKNK